jgi:hypothetical protein
MKNLICLACDTLGYASVEERNKNQRMERKNDGDKKETKRRWVGVRYRKVDLPSIAQYTHIDRCCIAAIVHTP